MAREAGRRYTWLWADGGVTHMAVLILAIALVGCHHAPIQTCLRPLAPDGTWQADSAYPGECHGGWEVACFRHPPPEVDALHQPYPPNRVGTRDARAAFLKAEWWPTGWRKCDQYDPGETYCKWPTVWPEIADCPTGSLRGAMIACHCPNGVDEKTNECKAEAK